MNYNSNTDDDDFMALVEWELNKRRGRSATYTQPLIGGRHPMSVEEEENVHSFLSEFYSYQIYDNMVNMKHTLQMYSDTVAVHYGLLVPNICSFDEFWSRYYYRCSIVQVKKDLIARQQRTGSYTDDYSDSTTNVDIVAAEQPPEAAELESLRSNDNNNNSSNNNTEGTNSNTTTTTTNSNNRTQMFYQENDRDIIEVIPEENDDDDNDNDEREFDTVCINENGDNSATTKVVVPSKHVAIGF
jgi:hypothetical protein